MRILSLLFVAVLFSLTGRSVSAALVLGYEVADAVSLTGTGAGSVTAANLIRGGGLTQLPGGTDYNSGNWSTGSFLEFGFTSTQNWDLTSLRFEIATQGAQAPATYTLQASIGGAAFSSFGASQTWNLSSDGFVPNFDLTSIQNVNDVNFRLLATDAVASPTSDVASQVRLIDNGNDFGFGANANFVIEGTVSAVPEPSSAIMLLACSAGLAFGRRRR